MRAAAVVYVIAAFLTLPYVPHLSVCMTTGTPAPPAAHHAPSYYSFRTTMAGEVSLLKRQLAARILPDDFWDWYLVKAGRSAISGSFATYVSNYVKAFGDRLTYMRDVGLTWIAVVFKPSMLDW
jgi:hypothetical protein